MFSIVKCSNSSRAGHICSKKGENDENDENESGVSDGSANAYGGTIHSESLERK